MEITRELREELKVRIHDRLDKKYSEKVPMFNSKYRKELAEASRARKLADLAYARVQKIAGNNGLYWDCRADKSRFTGVCRTKSVDDILRRLVLRMQYEAKTLDDIYKDIEKL